jgi:hypothetical protein
MAAHLLSFREGPSLLKTPSNLFLILDRTPDKPILGCSEPESRSFISTTPTFACTAYTSEEKPLGVVFTALIPGRRPQVSVAPIEAHVPRGWQELDDLP